MPEAVERPGGPLGIKAVADVVIWEGTLTTKAGVAVPVFVVGVGHFSLGLFFDPFGLPRFFAPITATFVVPAAAAAAAPAGAVPGVALVVAAVAIEVMAVVTALLMAELPIAVGVVVVIGERIPAAAIASK